MSEMSCKLIYERACIHRKVIETRSEKRIEKERSSLNKTKDNALIHVTS